MIIIIWPITLEKDSKQVVLIYAYPHNSIVYSSDIFITFFFYYKFLEFLYSMFPDICNKNSIQSYYCDAYHSRNRNWILCFREEQVRILPEKIIHSVGNLFLVCICCYQLQIILCFFDSFLDHYEQLLKEWPCDTKHCLIYNADLLI